MKIQTKTFCCLKFDFSHLRLGHMDKYQNIQQLLHKSVQIIIRKLLKVKSFVIFIQNHVNITDSRPLPSHICEP